ncbi:MAG: vitamin K epoxide reductase family protein [Elainellaceae cyanobacterium]
MSRRRQTPWLHRQSRKIIGAIALLGALNTAYLTATRLFGGEAACPTSGCQQVLSSPYATLFGLPLALFGLLAYLGMAAFAFAPLLVNADQSKTLRHSLDNVTWLLLFAGSTAMLVFSGYLMYIMFSEFVAPYGAAGICVYCIASALFALAVFVLTLLGRAWEDVGQLIFTGILVGVVVLVGSLAWHNIIKAPASEVVDGPSTPPVTTVSGPAEVELARHLKRIGAKMFGAYWCPHCHDQKQLFGQPAAAEIPYVECAPDGANSQADLCRATPQVTGYPTWEINGQFYSGTQTLEQLAQASGYQGPTNFQNLR